MNKVSTFRNALYHPSSKASSTMDTLTLNFYCILSRFLYDKDIYNSQNSITSSTPPTTFDTPTEVALTATVTSTSSVTPTSTVTPTLTVTLHPTIIPFHETTSSNNIEIHEVFYKNEFSNAYLTDERVLKSIVYNVTIMNPDKKLKLPIYYTSFTTTNLACRNNKRPNPP